MHPASRQAEGGANLKQYIAGGQGNEKMKSPSAPFTGPSGRSGCHGPKPRPRRDSSGEKEKYDALKSFSDCEFTALVMADLTWGASLPPGSDTETWEGVCEDSPAAAAAAHAGLVKEAPASRRIRCAMTSHRRRNATGETASPPATKRVRGRVRPPPAVR